MTASKRSRAVTMGELNHNHGSISVDRTVPDGTIKCVMLICDVDIIENVAYLRVGQDHHYRILKVKDQTFLTTVTR